MEMSDQIVIRNLSSTYLQQQAEALQGAYELLKGINRGCHLTSSQEQAMREASQVINEMAQDHFNAIKAVKAHEWDIYVVTEEAKKILDDKSLSLSINGRLALVVFEYPYLLDQWITLKGDTDEWVNGKFQHALHQMVREAISSVERRHLTIHAAIDEVWEKFEKDRPLMEDSLS
jgi:hypothetical protein